MTGNQNKPIFMLIFVSILTLVGLVYGFLRIPSPAEQRELKIDHQRVTALGELQYAIDEYYRDKFQLPTSLDDLGPNAMYSLQKLAKTDPETNKPYEYLVTSPTTYQLCAVFTTDSTKEEAFYDSENYQYSSYKEKFEHPKGRHCFSLETPYVSQPYTPSPTPSGLQIYSLPVSTQAAGTRFQILKP